MPARADDGVAPPADGHAGADPLGAEDILRLRLERQGIEARASGASADPAEVVAHLLAMQAQDYRGALWAVGLRCREGVALSAVEEAIAQRRIVRTWPMRGTLHFVAPEDVRWMLRLLSPRVIARAAKRHADLGLTDAVFDRARDLLIAALSGGRTLTRPDAMALLETDGIDTTGQRGYHILWLLAQQEVLCLGPMAGKHQTFVLLDEWIPPGETPEPTGQDALELLARRYLEAHGPATVADLAWWAGVTKTEAAAGLRGAGGLETIDVEDIEYWVPAAALIDGPASGPARSMHLLPGFDEYMLGYTDRALQLGRHHAKYRTAVAANGMFAPTLVADGRVVGTWKRTLRRDRVTVSVDPFQRLGRAERAAIAEEAERYGRFVGLPAVLEA
jgi:hypothetical protein